MMGRMGTESLAELREAYAHSRECIRRDFFGVQNPARTLEALTETVDDLARQICNHHRGGARFCALAIGGYGRRELYPHSDVDLLFVYYASEKEPAERVITSVLHDLWDSKLHLGHQVWPVEELRSLSLDDLEFVLSLLDGRLVAGDAALGAAVLEERLPAFVQANQAPLVDRIIAITEKRHRSYHDTIYHLEPDVKQAPGGLRDYLAGKWLSRFGNSVLFVPYSEAQIEGAHDLMRKLRIFLHFLQGRQQNQLTYRMQEELAQLAGYSEESIQAGVESLMMEYFLQARVLYAFCRKAICAKKRGPPVQELDIGETPALASPEDVLRVFLRSVAEDQPLSDGARNAVVEALPGFQQTSGFPRVSPVLRELLRPRPGLYRALCEMYELGVLELLFPEFGGIKARVIRDFYHKYTVDEHTLLAIKSVEELFSSPERSDGRFRTLLVEEEQADLLTIALLLHDVGKSRNGLHVDRSTSLAAKALRRLGLSRAEADTVLFLIRHHLTMASVVFRRDLEDSEVVRRFVDLVNDPRRLRLLCLMTYADIKAVAPGTLNDWKKDLLWQLYVAAYNKLTLGYGEERIVEDDIGERLLTELPAELDARGFERFLEGFPRRYLHTVPRAEIYEHFRLATRLDRDHPVQLHLAQRETYYELCTVTPDRSYLFAKIAGVMSYFDMNILRGFGFSNRENTVLDFFQFADTRGIFRLSSEEKEHFLDVLRQAVRDEIAVDRLLEGKERSVLFRSVTPGFPPSVHFDEDHARDYSIMEIVAPDSIGLLYRIGREISGLQCNIELVLISTEGAKAVDVFYVTQQGRRLSADVQDRLSNRILAVIG